MMTLWEALLAALVVSCLAAAVDGGGHRRPNTYPHLERDWQEMRTRCEAREGGCAELRGARHENCILRCMSHACYSWHYGNDALEEGEDDSTRGPCFRTCVLREVREAKAAAAGLPLQPLRVPGYKRYKGSS